MIVASIKGFGPGPYEDCKVYEYVAQCIRRLGFDHGFRDGLPLVTARRSATAAPAESGARYRSPALYQRTVTGKGQKVTASMQDGVSISRASNCATSSASPTARSRNTASSAKAFRSATPCRAPGNDSGGGQPAAS